MDAGAYLKRHGWRGSGHSLDKNDRGIKKPLLIAHKQDQLGLGKKKAAHSVDDQWWLRAFDESLQNIGTGQESTLNQIRKQGINRGGLYGFFVKGEGLAGTILDADENPVAELSSSDTSSTSSRTSTPPTTASETAEKIDFLDSSQSDSSSTSEVSPENIMFEAVAGSASGGDALADNPLKRKRAGKERPSNIRKRVKHEKMEVQKRNASLNRAKAREEAIANGTYDPDAERVEAVWRRIDRETKVTIQNRLNAGEFGAVIPMQMRKKGAPDMSFVEDPSNPGKKLTYKKAKYQREKGARDARKELKRSLVVSAMMKGDLPNPKNYTREEALTNYERDMKQRLKAEKLEHKRKKEELKEGKVNDEKAERQRAKAERREAKIAQAEESLTKQKGSATAEDAGGAAEAVSGKKKRIPLVGGVERYPTAREKRERKNAAAAGLTVEKYRANMEVEERKEAIADKIFKLSEQGKAQYQERALSKQLTLEQYVLRRILKKEQKQAVNNVGNGEAPSLFFTDLDGDTSIGQPGQAGPLGRTYQLNPDGSVPVDPIVWEGREVKSLSKEEREARRQYLANRRLERKIASGKVKPGQEPELTRSAKKMVNLRRLTGKLLLEQGIVSGASKQEINLARRRAKHQMKEEKKERKKAGTFKLVENKKNRHLVSERAKARDEMRALALSGATTV